MTFLKILGTSIFLFFLIKKISLNSPDLFSSDLGARVGNVKYRYDVL